MYNKDIYKKKIYRSLTALDTYKTIIFQCSVSTLEIHCFLVSWYHLKQCEILTQLSYTKIYNWTFNVSVW